MMWYTFHNCYTHKTDQPSSHVLLSFNPPYSFIFHPPYSFLFLFNVLTHALIQLLGLPEIFRFIVHYILISSINSRQTEKKVLAIRVILYMDAIIIMVLMGLMMLVRVSNAALSIVGLRGLGVEMIHHEKRYLLYGGVDKVG